MAMIGIRRRRQANQPRKGASPGQQHEQSTARGSPSRGSPSRGSPSRSTSPVSRKILVRRRADRRKRPDQEEDRKPGHPSTTPRQRKKGKTMRGNPVRHGTNCRPLSDNFCTPSFDAAGTSTFVHPSSQPKQAIAPCYPWLSLFGFACSPVGLATGPFSYRKRVCR
jgi:hypothetical protein